MANTDFTQAHNASNKFFGASLDELVVVMENRLKEIRESLNDVTCIARGGESWARSLDSNGAPKDLISGGIFHSIVNVMECGAAQRVQIDLQDTINELRRIAAQQPAAV